MSQPLQQALRDLDRAIGDSFRPNSDPAHKGWPKFKAKDIGDGFRIPQFAPEHIDDANGRVKLPKIGWIRYRRTRPIAFECADGMLVPGVVKQIHVRKDCGHWFVIFTVEFEVKVPDMKALDVGIDVGVVHAVATSDGRFYDLDTEKIRSIEKRIAGLKRKLSLNQESRKKLAKLGLAEPFDKKQPSCAASAQGEASKVISKDSLHSTGFQQEDGACARAGVRLRVRRGPEGEEHDGVRQGHR